MSRLAAVALVAALTAAGILAARPLGAQETPDVEAGAGGARQTYARWCAGCHGDDGAGDGPAARYMLPRPRDFTTGLYQIRSTPSGALPLDSDILAVIAGGMPGTAMPGWKQTLSGAEMEGLVEYLKTFSPFFASQEPPAAVTVGDVPGVSEEALAEGRATYEKIECWKCHGQAGRGDGPSAPTLEDEDDHPVRAADLTENWLFNGGGSVEAIYTRLLTGLSGTPMPSFADLVDAEVVTEEQLWNVAHYVRSLAPEKPPEVREVVRAARVEGELPAAPGDAAWAGAERYYVPLVGQIIARPRWFAPTVDGVWVQALHNGREVALRLTWHDPSKSPDSEWGEWGGRVAALMAPELAAPGAGPAADTTGATVTAGDTLAAPVATGAGASLPDRLVVQFPQRLTDGMERPYFLLGNAKEAVYLWEWASAPDGAREALGRGLGQTTPLPGAGSLTVSAAYDQGQWQLVIRRPLAAGDSTERLVFEPGRAIPMALFAWDGSNGESGTQGAISSWYFLYLDQPTAKTVYVAPILATLLTAALGVMVVTRAQRRAAGRANAPPTRAKENDSP
ncbi:MAG: c-type cytochrome [Gemmatimonadota bacterium]